MSHHVDDGRVWAYDTRTGDKRRVKPRILQWSRHLLLAPSERDKQVAIQEPATPSFEPDTTIEPVNTPDLTPYD